MSRMFEIMKTKDSYLCDNEAVIHYKDGEYTIILNNGKSLNQITGETEKDLNEFVEHIRKGIHSERF